MLLKFLQLLFLLLLPLKFTQYELLLFSEYANWDTILLSICEQLQNNLAHCVLNKTNMITVLLFSISSAQQL